jgi:agmatinase
MNPELVRVTPFMAARPNLEQARVVLFGCPFDGTSSYRPGSRFAPPAIRQVSDGLETFSPVLRSDLEDVNFADAGDLLLPFGDIEKALEMTYRMAAGLHVKGQIPAALGGEHLLTLPLFRATAEAHPDVVIIQFDAHLDMRNEYLDVSLSHATVMRRVSEIVQPSRILQVGPRSGTRDEFLFSESLGILRPTTITPAEIREWVGRNPVYVTVDLDVLDPSILPGTGTPEPGGVSFSTLEDWLSGLAGCRWVGWDVMELSPMLDASQISSIAAAKIVRTMLLASTARNF